MKLYIVYNTNGGMDAAFMNESDAKDSLGQNQVITETEVSLIEGALHV